MFHVKHFCNGFGNIWNEKSKQKTNSKNIDEDFRNRDKGTDKTA